MRKFSKFRKACALMLSLAALTLGSAMSVLAEEPAKLVSAAEPVLKISQTLAAPNGAPSAELAVPYTLSAAGDTDTAQVTVDGKAWSGSISFSLSGAAEQSWKLGFGKPGLYTFLLKQNLSAEEKTANSAYSFDDTVYTIRAYVKNAENGLFTEITAQKGNDTGSKVSAVVFANTYTKPSDGGNTDGGGSGGSGDGGSSGGSSGGGGRHSSGGGGGGGTTDWHSVTPQGGSSTTPQGGDVLGANRGPIGELIDTVSNSPVGQILGATRKAVQTGDSSTMAVMGIGFAACVCALGGWCLVYKKRRAEK